MPLRDRASRWLKALALLPKWDSLGSQCIPGGSVWCPRMESYSVRLSDPHVSVCLQKCEAAIGEQFPTGSVSRRGWGWGDSACFLMLRGAVPVSPKSVHTVFLEAKAEITWLAFTWEDRKRKTLVSTSSHICYVVSPNIDVSRKTKAVDVGSCSSLFLPLEPSTTDRQLLKTHALSHVGSPRPGSRPRRARAHFHITDFSLCLHLEEGAGAPGVSLEGPWSVHGGPTLLIQSSPKRRRF